MGALSASIAIRYTAKAKLVVEDEPGVLQPGATREGTNPRVHPGRNQPGISTGKGSNPGVKSGRPQPGSRPGASPPGCDPGNPIREQPGVTRNPFRIEIEPASSSRGSCDPESGL
ncbi:hypothetical protein L6452_17797 [Arctium lappa]|uniref:Uncharacterized protein n=1 Tax=Arctium lappa TaxID=4217 RepID=A0ACB9C4P0_ARCLA|nr:hypothetical protein L6452_17797 [Arctium lappa]